MMVDGSYGRKEQEGLLKCLQGMELVIAISFLPVAILECCFSCAPISSLVVNCIQSHPYDCAVATSGIDNTIKVFDLILFFSWSTWIICPHYSLCLCLLLVMDTGCRRYFYGWWTRNWCVKCHREQPEEIMPQPWNFVVSCQNFLRSLAICYFGLQWNYHIYHVVPCCFFWSVYQVIYRN